MPMFRRLSFRATFAGMSRPAAFASGVAIVTAGLFACAPAHAQTMPAPTGNQGADHAAMPSNTGGQDRSGTPGSQGEHYTAHGKHSLPPGYQDAPSNEINHGPDPDHFSNIERDPVTGADLSKFGSSYSNSSPTQQGSLGDATGNGWVAPH